MTKKKTDPFKGAWINENVPRDQLIQRLEAEPGFRMDSNKVARVLNVLSWHWGRARFDMARRAADPEPGQWLSLIKKIHIPEQPTQTQVLEILRQVRNLPAHLRAYVDTGLFRLTETGTAQLNHNSDLGPLRAVLDYMVQTLPYVRGKRGPKFDVGPALRAVTASIIEHTQMRKGPARMLAADLMAITGFKVPQDRRRLSKLVNL